MSTGKLVGSDPRWIQYFTARWDVLSTALKSPITRLGALLPLFGYIIIYGEVFEDLLTFPTLGPDLFLTTEIRLRLLYYGGVLIMLAAVVHYFRCPDIMKRHPDAHAYLQEFTLAPRPAHLHAAGFELIRMVDNSRLDPNVVASLFNALIMRQGLGNSQRTFAKQAEKVTWNSNDIARLLTRSGENWVTLYEQQAFRNACTALLSLHYQMLSTSLRGSRMVISLLILIGGVLAAIPAAETFLRVLVIDVSALNVSLG